MSNINELKNTIKILDEKIKEYKYVEKYFGIDDNDEILYDEYKDQKFALENINKKKKYTNYTSFCEWVDDSKTELIQKHKNLTNKLNKLNSVQKINPSDEQLNIVKNISKNNHTYVDAVAGSGKTTTVLLIAEKNKNKKILQITYNKQLKFEVREKSVLRELNNLTIHTYHSFAVSHYDSNSHTDDGIIKILNNNTKPKKKINIDILIIDECQDMTGIYYALICKMIGDMKIDLTNIPILLLGDKYQAIYDFKGSDVRYLTMGNNIFVDVKKATNFDKLTLKQSYRLTSNIAWFINKCILGYDRIEANRSGKNVIYFKTNLYSCHVMMSYRIFDLIKGGYKPSDIFILSPSVKSNKSPVKKLENLLVKNHIPVYISRNDEKGFDEDVIKDKLVISTFHQAKGRERKIVFVYGFDDSYFDFHAKDKNRNICPSEIYVAITRASEILVLIEGSDKNPFEFLKMTHDQMKQNKSMITFIEDIKKVKPKIKKEKEDKDYHTTSITELIDYLDDCTIQKLTELVSEIAKIETESDDLLTVEIPKNITTENGKCEDVSDITGIAIPALFENQNSKKSSLQDIVSLLYKNVDSNTKEFIDKKMVLLNKYLSKKNDLSAYLLLSNIYIALNEKIYSKLNQIDKYNWLTKDMIKICFQHLENNIGKNPIYELELGDDCDDKDKKCYTHKSDNYGEIKISGRIDCVDNKVLWEFKSTSSLQIEHKLQMILYAFVWEKCMKDKFGSKIYKLLNITDGELIRIKYDSFIVNQIVEILLEHKYGKIVKDTDEEFIKKCNKTRQKFINGKNVELKFEVNNYDSENEDDVKITKNLFI